MYIYISQTHHNQNLRQLRASLANIRERGSGEALLARLSHTDPSATRETLAAQRRLQRDVAEKEEKLRQRAWANELAEMRTGAELLRAKLNEAERAIRAAQAERSREEERVRAKIYADAKQNEDTLRARLIQLDRIDAMGKSVLYDRKRASFLQSLARPIDLTPQKKKSGTRGRQNHRSASPQKGRTHKEREKEKEKGNARRSASPGRTSKQDDGQYSTDGKKKRKGRSNSKLRKLADMVGDGLVEEMTVPHASGT